MTTKQFTLRFALLIVISGTFSLTTFGWGRLGHHIIADLAKSHTTRSVQDSVNKYLSGESWHETSVWMDVARRYDQYDYMRNWHFINIEEGEVYSPTIAGGNNVITQLDIAIANLKNRQNLTPYEIKLNLRVLFHLMGDLHNPLHVGYGIDRGGNTIDVFFNNDTLSLHRFWDAEVLESQNDVVGRVTTRFDRTRRRTLRNMSKGNAQTWHLDARAALPVVYSFTSNTITSDYQKRSFPVANNLLILSGVRLGATLNDIFGR